MADRTISKRPQSVTSPAQKSRAVGQMIVSRTTLPHDEADRCYAGELDFWGFPYRVEIRQSWKNGKQAVEVTLLAPEARA